MSLSHITISVLTLLCTGEGTQFPPPPNVLVSGLAFQSNLRDPKCWHNSYMKLRIIYIEKNSKFFQQFFQFFSVFSRESNSRDSVVRPSISLLVCNAFSSRVIKINFNHQSTLFINQI